MINPQLKNIKQVQLVDSDVVVLVLLSLGNPEFS